jgi:hypothetical protein
MRCAKWTLFSRKYCKFVLEFNVQALRGYLRQYSDRSAIARSQYGWGRHSWWHVCRSLTCIASLIYVCSGRAQQRTAIGAISNDGVILK